MSESANSSEPELLDIRDEEALRALLEGRGFDTSTWGEGATKSVADLWEELDEGETQILQAGNELIRRTHVAAVDVMANLSSGERYQLVESKQIYTGGWVRERSLITSLAEKIKPTEDTEMAVRRAVAEELGIQALKNLELLGEQVMYKPSTTFNGISTQLLLRLAKVEIAEEDFDPDGYVEHQAEKSVYFSWRRLG
jgi:hypothetical protein